MDDYSYLFKIILIGDANVGKTCLVKRFTKGFFTPTQGPTIGVDFTIRTVEVDGEKVKVFFFFFATSIVKCTRVHLIFSIYQMRAFIFVQLCQLWRNLGFHISLAFKRTISRSVSFIICFEIHEATI